MRGAELAVKQRNGMVAGKKIEIIKASSDAKPDVAVNATRKLVEQDKVDIMVGPLSGSEGIAVKNYSKSQPNTTFINGSSGAQATTLQDPSPNFFRFNTEGAQWMVGLGEYAFKDKGFKKMALIAEDYAFPYSQVQGFMTEYCKLGGQVTHKAWVPLGGKDYSSVIAKLPGDVDALLVVLGGADAVNFLTQYEQAGGNKPMVGGSITVDQTVLNFKGKRRESLLGTPSAGPIADSYEAPEWKKFVADYKANFKDGFPSPSLFAYVYYINMKAALDGLEAVKGDLSGGQAKYREALKNLKLQTPDRHVTLDENRQAIGTTFVTEVAKGADGGFFNKVVKVVPSVEPAAGHVQGRLRQDRARLPGRPQLPVSARWASSPLAWLPRQRASTPAPIASGDALVLEGVTRTFGALARHRGRLALRRRGRAPRAHRRQRRRQDHAVQRRHRRLSADRGRVRFFGEDVTDAAAPRAHPHGPAPHLPVLAPLPGSHGGENLFLAVRGRGARPLRLPAPARGAPVARRHPRSSRPRAPGGGGGPAGRRRCPTASSASSRSAWRWRGRRGSSCSTSPPRACRPPSGASWWRC